MFKVKDRSCYGNKNFGSGVIDYSCSLVGLTNSGLLHASRAGYMLHIGHTT